MFYSGTEKLLSYYFVGAKNIEVTRAQSAKRITGKKQLGRFLELVEGRKLALYTSTAASTTSV